MGKLLGTGANGQVYAGMHISKGHDVAIKLTNLRTSSFSEAEGNHHAERVLKEAHMLKTLTHSKIIYLEDVFMMDNVLYMVMEVVRGGLDIYVVAQFHSNSIGGDLFERVVSKGRYDEESVS
jgi:serine/threonine protein kinase